MVSSYRFQSGLQSGTRALIWQITNDAAEGVEA
jgi:hypothetical protein